MKRAATLFLPFLLMAPKSFASTPSTSAELYQVMAAEMALDRDQPDVALANYIALAKETQDAEIAARATQIALNYATLETALTPALIWAKTDPTNLEAQITTAALYLRMDQ